MPERAKIITHMFGVQKDNKNAYILFESKEAQQKALELNQSLFMDKHLRVDSIRQA
jgi:nucleolar protein 12